ncbi:DNA polymerase zeta catalytic subunit-like [Hibiscus syriacus]|uniref:DNA polymerase zeta catalytic subunit-like n=1 Tax=Hibiscus syriacus TaxID=106335 RepID=UPI001921EEB2|nr:DNA polymerase zeta catalytic subunit-like [Hibiscus syriacus]
MCFCIAMLDFVRGVMMGYLGLKCLFSMRKNTYLVSMDILCSLDPDILMGWDVQGCSLGFLAERASYLGIGLLNKISRTPSETKIKAEETNTSEKGLEDELLLQPLVADNVVTEDAIIEDEF